MDEGFNGFVIGALVVLAGVFITSCVPPVRHDVGWGHTVCVKTTDRTGSAHTTTIHCVSGEELATWAKEKGR